MSCSPFLKNKYTDCKVCGGYLLVCPGCTGGEIQKVDPYLFMGCGSLIRCPLCCSLDAAYEDKEFWNNYSVFDEPTEEEEKLMDEYDKYQCDYLNNLVKTKKWTKKTQKTQKTKKTEVKTEVKTKKTEVKTQKTEVKLEYDALLNMKFKDLKKYAKQMNFSGEVEEYGNKEDLIDDFWPFYSKK